MKLNLKKLLIKHEGLCLKPYHDSLGKLTIGVGRNLDDVGITEQEALQLLDNDIAGIINQLNSLSVFNQLNSSQQIALTDMAFNLGFQGILQFKKMWAALEGGNFSLAAKEMLDSKWAEQVPCRAKELAEIISNDCQ